MTTPRTSKADRFDSLDNDADFSVNASDFAAFTDDDPETEGRRRADSVYSIRLENITAKDQVREEFDEDAHRELVASLEKHGQQQPIRVRWSPEDRRYVIIQGERRYRAAKDAQGIDDLMCVVETKNLSPGQLIELQIVENTHRKNLNPVEEAKAYRELMDIRGCTAKDLALDIGVSPVTVQRCVKLLTLPEDILAKVAKGELPKSLMRSIQSITGSNAAEQQRQLIAEYEETGQMTAVMEKAKKKPSASKSSTPFKRSGDVGDFKLLITSKKKTHTNADIYAAIMEWAKDFKPKAKGRAA